PSINSLLKVTESSPHKNAVYSVDGWVLVNIKLEPHEILSISVLDAEVSVPVYGEQGKHGVVIITTKHGSLKQDSLSPNIAEEFELLQLQNIGRQSDPSKNSTPKPELPVLIDGEIGDINSLNPESIHATSVYNIDKTLEYGPIA